MVILLLVKTAGLLVEKSVSRAAVPEKDKLTSRVDEVSWESRVTVKVIEEEEVSEMVLDGADIETVFARKFVMERV